MFKKRFICRRTTDFWWGSKILLNDPKKKSYIFFITHIRSTIFPTGKQWALLLEQVLSYFFSSMRCYRVVSFAFIACPEPHFTSFSSWTNEFHKFLRVKNRLTSCLSLQLMSLSGILTVFFCGIVMSHYTWHNVSESSRITSK